jgi:hypothetical protein
MMSTMYESKHAQMNEMMNRKHWDGNTYIQRIQHILNSSLRNKNNNMQYEDILISQVHTSETVYV